MHVGSNENLKVRLQRDVRNLDNNITAHLSSADSRQIMRRSLQDNIKTSISHVEVSIVWLLLYHLTGFHLQLKVF